MFARDEELEKRLGRLFVEAAMEQDTAAMEEVMGYALPALTERVARWCNRRSHSRSFAEIVAGKTLMKALAAADKFDPGKPLMAWLVGIAWHEFVGLCCIERRVDRNQSLDRFPVGPSQDDDELNKARRREILTPLEELVGREDNVRRERQRELLDALICSLPDLKRRIVELYRAGTPVGAIAISLEIPPARVSKILFEAKAQLRRRLG